MQGQLGCRRRAAAAAWTLGDEQEGRPMSDLEGWLANRRGRPIAPVGATSAGVSAAAEGALVADLRYALNNVRRQRDEVEPSDW